MKNRSIVILICVIFQSCIFIHVDDSIDLGNGFRYIQDTPETIIWHNSQDYEGVGNTVIPPQVIDYSYNENYIIAKSVASNGKNLRYWIIDKNKEPQNIEALDSTTFFHQLYLLDIPLDFK
jgi:hypothetical protein